MTPVLASIPSPSSGVLHLGPVPLRAYAFFIIVGVVLAATIGDRRWVAAGGRKGTVPDVAVFAVPAGLIGARLYHVVTSYQLYFPGHPLGAFEVWKGGLGIWGGVAGGALGAWWACRRRGISLAAYADAVAPGIAVAQAVGRLGNYFNQELFGGPTSLPWALHITHPADPTIPPGFYHPTFLYELLWDLGVAAVVVLAGRRWRLDRGRSFWLYVALYVVGRAWVEALRIDDANLILGVRLNDWTSLLVFILAVGVLLRSRRRAPLAFDATPYGAVPEQPAQEGEPHDHGADGRTGSDQDVQAEPSDAASPAGSSTRP